MEKDYKRYKELLEMYLVDFLPDVDQKSKTVYEAMKYSLMAGGKRIRPALLLGACEFCEGDIKSALPYACALEYVHTYSLIHDDLPAMDDDDLRRGIETNHVVYGEAMAILAGDGLLTTAFEIMYKDMFLFFDDSEKLKKRIRAAYEIAKGAGCDGMIAGQVADIEAEGTTCSGEFMDYININKTGALIVAAVRAGVHIGNGNEEMLSRLTDYAECFGLAFQISDDILDITGDAKEMGKATEKDKERGKATYPELYGLDESRRRVRELTDEALEAMAPYYDNAEFFNNLIVRMAERTK